MVKRLSLLIYRVSVESSSSSFKIMLKFLRFGIGLKLYFVQFMMSMMSPWGFAGMLQFELKYPSLFGMLEDQWMVLL